MTRRAKPVRKFFKPRAIIMAALAVAVVLLLFNHFGNKKTATTIQSTNPASSSETSKNSSKPNNTSSLKATAVPGSESQGNGQPATATSATSAPLKTPYGDFVSNHSPGQNGSGASEVSTCITTPGATCYIELKAGSETKLLKATTTDNTGTAYWDWDVNDPVKLSPGSWTITAVAALNGQTKSAKDPRALIIL
jgi:hypothetical protein